MTIRKMVRIMKRGAASCLLLGVLLLILATTKNKRTNPRHTVTLNAQVKYHLGSFQSPGDLQCHNHICSGFLTSQDMPHWKYCWTKTKLREEPGRSTCHFLNGTGRHPVALASFPGSGNTWVRGLLQQITGVCTGGIYCDTTLRTRGFPGEGIRSGVTLVVKTHQTDPRWSGVTYDESEPFKYFKRLRDVPVYSAAILLVRNPFDALVAEWHREQTVRLPDNHVTYVGMEHFRENKEWDAYVHSQAVEWQNTIIGWLIKNKGHPVMLIKFEDLKRNTEIEVMRMLDFLLVPYTEQQVMEVVESGFMEFKRKQRHAPSLEHYTAKQVAHVNEVLRTTVQLLDVRRLSHVCSISDYVAL